MSEANKELVRRFEELFNRKALAVAVVAPTGKRFAARQGHWSRVADGR